MKAIKIFLAMMAMMLGAMSMVMAQFPVSNPVCAECGGGPCGGHQCSCKYAPHSEPEPEPEPEPQYSAPAQPSAPAYHDPVTPPAPKPAAASSSTSTYSSSLPNQSLYSQHTTHPYLTQLPQFSGIGVSKIECPGTLLVEDAPWGKTSLVDVNTNSDITCYYDGYVCSHQPHMPVALETHLPTGETEWKILLWNDGSDKYFVRSFYGLAPSNPIVDVDFEGEDRFIFFNLKDGSNLVYDASKMWNGALRTANHVQTRLLPIKVGDRFFFESHSLETGEYEVWDYASEYNSQTICRGDQLAYFVPSLVTFDQKTNTFAIYDFNGNLEGDYYSYLEVFGDERGTYFVASTDGKKFRLLTPDFQNLGTYPSVDAAHAAWRNR